MSYTEALLLISLTAIASTAAASSVQYILDIDIGIEQAILNYLKVVINIEWAALKRREASPEAVSAFQAIVEAAGRLNTTRPTDLTLQGQILSLLAQAHASRETRIFQADQGLPMIIWAVLTSILLSSWSLCCSREWSRGLGICFSRQSSQPL